MITTSILFDNSNYGNNMNFLHNIPIPSKQRGPSIQDKPKLVNK